MRTMLKRLLCRIVGHNWGHLKGFYDGHGRIEEYGLTCQRCWTTRIVPAPRPVGR